jgi:hypothetical protein
MNLHLSEQHINSLSNLEQEELFKSQIEKYNYLNQTIDGYKFSIVSTLPELQKLAEKMKNAAFFYKNFIMRGEYLILTIDNRKEEDFTNFGLYIKDSQLIFDNVVKLRLKQNLIAPYNTNQAFQKFAQKNNIIINEQ